MLIVETVLQCKICADFVIWIKIVLGFVYKVKKNLFISHLVSSRYLLVDKRHPLTGKYRHHSVEDDYYSAYPPYGPYGYYNGYGMPYNSQPSIYRSPSREGKYPPNMRFNQVQYMYA